MSEVPTKGTSPIDGTRLKRQDLLRGMRVGSEDLCARRSTEGLFSESLESGIVFRSESWESAACSLSALERLTILDEAARDSILC
jgi:hypothetical protein